MHRRKRIRRSLHPTPMDIDGSGEVDHSKPVAPTKREYAPTNIEVLTSKIQKLGVKSIADEAKKTKKIKYIDTSVLLNFKRESKKNLKDA